MFQLDTSEFPRLTRCCNRHDLCYDTCGKERHECDEKFKTCVQKSCKAMRDKKEIGKQQYDGMYVTIRE